MSGEEGKASSVVVLAKRIPETTPKPEARAFWRDSLTKLHFVVTAVEVAITCPTNVTDVLSTNGMNAYVCRRFGTQKKTGFWLPLNVAQIASLRIG